MKGKLYTLTETGLLIALILLLDLTGLGYPRFGIVQMTLIGIPVLIGAIRLGPGIGALLGGVFGATSFSQCFRGDPFGATLLTIDWLRAAVLCILPRILMGLLAGLIFAALKKQADKGWPFWLTGLCGSLFNTVLFTGTLILLFWQSDYLQGLAAGRSVLLFAAGLVGINGLIEAGVCTLLTGAICFAMHKAFDKRRK